jgi:septal ring factor EnvC (AmiA/AmiB activator)
MSYAYQPQPSEDDKRRDFLEIEREMTIFESDLKKIQREKEALGFEYKRRENQIKRLKLELEEIVEKKRKTEKEEYYMLDEINKLKKKRNTLI